jgi:hypothetical protein
MDLLTQWRIQSSARSRRLLGLPPVILEPPPPPLRRKLDQQGSFKATGFQTIEPKQLPEESIANLGPVETPTTDTWPQVIVPIQFYESLSVPHTAMATNVVTSSGNSSIPITIATTGEASPNLPLLVVRATMVSAATTSHSGPTPSIAAATPPFTPSAIGPPFSYGMPSSGTSPALTHSTLQTLGLGAGSSNAPLQDQLGGIPVPFNAFPYGGGHISPSSPSLGGPHQQSVGQPTHTSSFGARSQGTPAQTQSVGSSPFVWNGTFGNNTFASTAAHLGAHPFLDSLLRHRVLFLCWGHIYQDLGTQDKDPFLPLECRSGVILSTVNGTLDRLLCLSPRDQHGVILPKVRQT